MCACDSASETRIMQRRTIATVLISAALAGCGGTSGDDTAAGVADGAADPTSSPEPEDVPSERGGRGHWTAAELCALIDLDELAPVFSELRLKEQPGIDELDWSACGWRDADGPPLAPTVVGVSSREFGGGPLSDSFAPVELAGADQAVLAVGMADAFGFPTVLLTVAGGEILEVGIEQTGPDAEAFVTDVSSRWLERQSG